MTTENLFFKYHFTFEDGTEENFLIELDGNSLDYIQHQKPVYPNWTKLENHQCENCLLNSSTHSHCPVAVNLHRIFEPFKDKLSYNQVLVRVETQDRTFEHNTALQRALSSMIGIFMVSSGCPTMNILKPMVRFHLPFATVEETIFRSAASYLLGQYFRYKNNKVVDWHMNKLSDAYESIQLVNISMAHRLRSISEQDAGVNAVIVLDVFAKELPFTIHAGLSKLEYLYKDFIDIDEF